MTIADPRVSVDINFTADVPLVLSDGTTLYADVYSPTTDELVPVLLMRHPYSKRRMPMFLSVDVLEVVRAGYIVVFQDVRGRYTSEGDFQVMTGEGPDGEEAIAWARTLPGANGLVGTWGSSYGADVQWSTALQPGHQQDSIISVNSPAHSPFNGFLWRGGARELGTRVNWCQRSINLGELTRTHPDLTAHEVGALYDATQEDLDTGAIFDTRPLMDIARRGGMLQRGMETFTESPADPVNHVNRTTGRYEEVDAPALIVGGWFDCFLGSTLAQYRGMRVAAAARSASPAPLVIGPWSHQSFTHRLGDLHFGQDAVTARSSIIPSFTELFLRWADATLKGRMERTAGLPGALVFLMGSNRWLALEQFPPRGNATSYHLGAEGGLHGQAAPIPGHVDFDYDPTDPVPTLGGAILMPPQHESGPLDQSALDDRGDIVHFTGEPLERDVHVIGDVSAELVVTTSAADTDFVVRLLDVHPDSTPVLIADGITRCSRRDDFSADGTYLGERTDPVVPGEAFSVSVSLLATAHTFRAGHRIRVDVTSSSFPRWDPNPNTGGTLFTSTDTVVASQRIHTGPDGSRVLLPVVSQATVEEATLDTALDLDTPRERS